MKDKLINVVLIIISVFLIVPPFVLNYSIDKKVILTAACIGLLANLIKNKKIRYLIGAICLLVLLFAAYRWRENF